ncbi:MAG: flagellar biosynthetic protein FliO [Spirochaetales bacterium]|nr:flagellar biosynthetic protein FliO [Spirochaetales bacterium]
MILVLGAVVGVIYLLFFILKKGTRKKFADNELIDIIASKDLAGGKAVHLIKIGESIFLIGAADNSINLISRITEQETLDSLKLEISEKGRGAKKSFQNALSDIFSRKNKGDPVEESMDFLKKQRERLHKLK